MAHEMWVILNKIDREVGVIAEKVTRIESDVALLKKKKGIVKKVLWSMGIMIAGAWTVVKGQFH
jgi:hypothetical protein